MEHIASERISWKKALKRERPLLLPVAHDGLSAKLIEQAGFAAVQVGGFAVAGSRHGLPDIDLTHFAERHAAVKDIMSATALPIMVDDDDGYGDAKNVVHTVKGYLGLGIQGMFIEDQRAPKKCGHMADKEIIPVEEMVKKVKAAVSAREGRELFILARTDAFAPEGLEKALERGEAYLKAGADGIYVEGPTSEKELRVIGKEFRGEELATSVLENGGKTPWLSPREFGRMGFTMILYPTTLLFSATFAVREAARNLRKGRPLDARRAVTMDEFEEIVELSYWKQIEEEFK